MSYVSVVHLLQLMSQYSTLLLLTKVILPNFDIILFSDPEYHSEYTTF